MAGPRYVVNYQPQGFDAPIQGERLIFICVRCGFELSRKTNDHLEAEGKLAAKSDIDAIVGEGE
jgi:hypothetical protein